MKVFIENEAGSSQKNIFNEKTLEYKKTYDVSAAYPFPYGFVISTTSGDGDNLDCFVLTQKPLKSRDIVDVEPVGMFEQVENSQEDHKVLAVLPEEHFIIDEETQDIFRKFIKEVFSHRPNHRIALGRFLGKQEALELVKKSQDLKNVIDPAA
ncbi:MAG: inorganic diphosphatase [Candidatus Andersenbacteria bacterium]|nr:inorganic diphosphatase [Candidatus Andersenbacteria bacterium]